MTLNLGTICPNRMLCKEAIGAVSFDAGGTLIEAAPSVGHVYAQVASEFGVSGLNPENLSQRFFELWHAKENFNYSREEWYALVRAVFGEHSARLPEAFFPAIYDRFAGPEAWRVCPDAWEALDVLASHDIPMAVISNWDERLRPLLARLKLIPFFHAIVISREVAFAKPSPVIFEVAARKLGLPPERILHVGDSYTEDVEGARAAGFQAVLLARNKTADLPNQIVSLKQLKFFLNGN